MKSQLDKNTGGFKGKILVIDDDPEIGWIFSKILSDYGYELALSDTEKDGLSKVRKFAPDLIFLDLKLGETDGIQVLKKIKEINHNVRIVMITAHATIQTAVSAMKLGACDYIPKPVPNESLKLIVDKIFNSHCAFTREFSLSGEDALKRMIIGESPAMRELFEMIKKAADYDINVFLQGESGTGKELVARAIHGLSKRNKNPFVPIDCATLPDTLVESELFGHEKGAFTGAMFSKAGKFEQANGGTVFLDEIGNLTPHTQVKLLRILQERKVEHIGGGKIIDIDIRLITATNKDLREAIRRNEFRDDLYHRFNVFEIKLPPLRERGDDILLLSQYFLDLFNKELGKNISGFSEEVLGMFRSYRWPGNVRELGNVIKTSVILSPQDVILPCHIHFHMESNTGETTPGVRISGDSLTSNGKTPLKEAKKKITREVEKYLIEKTLRETNWNKKKTAEILEIDYKNLFNKIKEYDLKRGKLPPPPPRHSITSSKSRSYGLKRYSNVFLSEKYSLI